MKTNEVINLPQIAFHWHSTAVVTVADTSFGEQYSSEAHMIHSLELGHGSTNRNHFINHWKTHPNIVIDRGIRKLLERTGRVICEVRPTHASCTLE